MKFLLIVNSAAGQHRTDDVQTELVEAFQSELPAISYTDAAGDAERHAFDGAMSGKFDAIVAVGGDGTVNEVVNGLMAAQARGKSATLGVIPTGTSNILASELRIPWPDIASSVDVLLGGRTQKIDLCRQNDRYFLLMASFGIDAEAVRDVFLPLKGIVGPGAYVMSGLAALAKYEPSKMTLSLDDEVVTFDAFLAVVANVSNYALAGVKIAPFAAIDDGWLDVCIFEKPPLHRIGFVGQVMLMLARRHLGDPRFRYYRARKVRIESQPQVAAQLDGDPIGDTPVEIEIVPNALNIIVPAGISRL